MLIYIPLYRLFWVFEKKTLKGRTYSWVSNKRMNPTNEPYAHFGHPKWKEISEIEMVKKWISREFNFANWNDEENSREQNFANGNQVILRISRIWQKIAKSRNFTLAKFYSPKVHSKCIFFLEKFHAPIFFFGNFSNPHIFF